MIDAPRPADEAARLAALRRYQILDTPPEPAFDRLTRLAADMLGTPMALVSLVDAERQWFKSARGLDTTETDRAFSFCAHAVHDQRMLVVPDALADPRFADNPLVTGAPGIRFYAGAPLTTPDGFTLGTVCALDTTPHGQGISDLQRQQLTDLAALAVNDLELRRHIWLLEEQRRQLELVTVATNAATDAVMITDPSLDAPDGPAIVYANDAFLRMSGRPLQDVIGATPRIVQGPGTDRDALARIRQALERGEVIREELLNYQADGSSYWTELEIAPVRDRDDRITNFVSVQRDVTARKALEAQLVHAQKMEAVGELAGGIAHDFNNLLTVINGYTQLLVHRLGKHDPIQAELLQIQRAGERATRLTGQLLAFSRRQVLQPRVVSVPEVVRTFEPMLTRVLRENVQLTLNLPGHVPDVIVDPHQLEQVLLNLAINASDAMPEGGQLTIECHQAEVQAGDADTRQLKPGGYVIVAVSDNGVGMDEATRQRVFEPFFTTKPKGRGTGLGLPTAYGIVKQSGGHIAVYSEPGYGSTFRVYLPVAVESERMAGPSPEPEAEPLPVAGETNILLAEDDEAVRRLTADILTRAGYRVTVAEDGAAAIRLAEAREWQFDLLVTDVIMPRMDGRMLADTLQRHNSRLRVLFMSGYTENAIVHHGVLEPGLHFLSKPFTPADLLAQVREALRSPDHTRTVVIADDEAPLRKLLGLTLKRAGYVVLEARDGKEAIALCRSARVDLLLTDLVMPEQEGLETIRVLRAELPHVAIVAMSGAFDGAFLKVATTLGASAVLQKPFDGRTVVKTVAELIGTPATS